MEHTPRVFARQFGEHSNLRVHVVQLGQLIKALG
jgi:hypothetical protein